MRKETDWVLFHLDFDLLQMEEGYDRHPGRGKDVVNFAGVVGQSLVL